MARLWIKVQRYVGFSKRAAAGARPCPTIFISSWKTPPTHRLHISTGCEARDSSPVQGLAGRNARDHGASFDEVSFLTSFLATAYDFNRIGKKAKPNCE